MSRKRSLPNLCRRQQLSRATETPSPFPWPPMSQKSAYSTLGVTASNAPSTKENITVDQASSFGLVTPKHWQQQCCHLLASPLHTSCPALFQSHPSPSAWHRHWPLSTYSTKQENSSFGQSSKYAKHYKFEPNTKKVQNKVMSIITWVQKIS